MTCLLMLGWVASTATPARAFGSSEPPPLPSVSAGGYITCALQADGTAACWGENGVPSNDIPNVQPGGAATPPPGVRFLELNSGYAISCGITTEQAVLCFGSARGGKLNEPAGTFTHVAPGLNYICALRTDGTLACWGGEDNPTQDALFHNNVPSGTFTQVTMGNRHACALRADGSIACWGVNADGQTNVPPGSYSYVNVSNFTSCALRIDGTPVCWGRNQGGQQTYPPGTFTQISTGFAHVCGLRADLTVTCWGRNSEGQTIVPAGTYTHVSAGTFHTCAMPTSGPPAVCWGNNAGGRMQPSLSTIPPVEAFFSSPYSFQLTMATYVSPAPTYELVAGSLPPGITLSPTGLLSGTSDAPGIYTFTVRAISNGLSPPDCVQAGGGDLSCTPGDSTSIATATRTYKLEVYGDPLVAGSIAGTVTALQTGAPVAGAPVTVTYPSGAPAGQTTTDAGGTYTVGGLPPGTYRVTASGPELEPQTQLATVEPEQTDTVDFVLGPLIRPTVVSVSNNTFQTVTDGLFITWSENILPPLALDTNYTVHAGAGCTGPAIATGLNGNWQGTAPRLRDLEMSGWSNVVTGGTYWLQVLPGTETSAANGRTNALACVQFVAQLAPADRAAVQGVVSGTTGSPIAGATVSVTRVVRDIGTVAAQAITDATGSYSAQGFNWGTYDVVASAPGYRSKTTRMLLPGGRTTTLNFTLTALPSANDDAYTHYGTDTALVVPAPGVRGNDADADGDPLMVALVTGPDRGSLTLNADGSFTYQPVEDDTGTVSFTYSASDGTSSDTATVTITLAAGCRGRAATITGTSGADRLKGTAGDDVIAGLGGDDKVTAEGGDDLVCGGGGDDNLNGGDGGDELVGGSGADRITGEGGSDVLAGGAGSPDHCIGGDGVDALAPEHGCERVNDL